MSTGGYGHNDVRVIGREERIKGAILHATRCQLMCSLPVQYDVRLFEEV